MNDIPVDVWYSGRRGGAYVTNLCAINDRASLVESSTVDLMMNIWGPGSLGALDEEV